MATPKGKPPAPIVVANETTFRPPKGYPKLNTPRPPAKEWTPPKGA
jgi:hypothetical protein